MSLAQRPVVTPLILILFAVSSLFVGCARPMPQASPHRDALAEALPTIVGEVVGDDGRPIVGAEVHVHSGFGTLFPILTCRTDADGSFRAPITEGATIEDRDGKSSYIIGVSIEHPDVQSAGGGTHWYRSVSTTPGTVRQLKFTVRHGAVIASEA